MNSLIAQSQFLKRHFQDTFRRWVYFSGGRKQLMSLLFESVVMRSLVHILQEDDGYLQKTGWIRSWQTRVPMIAENQYIPWLTYPFIEFLSERLQPSFHLFEFGCGASTRYYGQKVAFVDAIEHDPKWIPKLTDQEKENIKIYLIPLKEQKRYTNILSRLDKKYHIIVIDGRYRISTVQTAVEYLSEDGVIILDESNRSGYDEAKLIMKEKGFRQLDFYGMKALRLSRCCTTLFYRKHNCLQV